MNFFDRVKRWFAGTVNGPTERQIADMLFGGGIEDDHFPSRVTGEKFDSGITYFGLRLSGIHLVDARQFATKRLPLCVCLAEFETGGERRAIPFSIGPDVIRKKLKDAGVTEHLGGSAWIELRDITIVRPTPTNDANLSLYTGLFSVPGDDLVKTLLNVVGTVGTALANPAVGPALKVSETIYDSFGSLLGFNQVQQVVAALIGSALNEQGSGYLLVANVDPQKFPLASARIKNGRLHWPADQNGGNPVIEFDHALLALERFDTVAEKGTGLAESLFGQAWAAVRKAGKPEVANEALEKLRDAISASPDLTEDDRLKLLTAYGSAAMKLNEARGFNQKTAGAETRGAAAAAIKTRLSEIAATLDERAEAGDAKVAERLRIAAVKIDGLPELPDPKSVDAERTHQGDMDAILELAQQIKLPKPELGDGSAHRAAVAAAHAIAPTLQ